MPCLFSQTPYHLEPNRTSGLSSEIYFWTNLEIGMNAPILFWSLNFLASFDDFAILEKNIDKSSCLPLVSETKSRINLIDHSRFVLKTVKTNYIFLHTSTTHSIPTLTTLKKILRTAYLLKIYIGMLWICYILVERRIKSVDQKEPDCLLW